jgi:hypothetical protein
MIKAGAEEPQGSPATPAPAGESAELEPCGRRLCARTGGVPGEDPSFHLAVLHAGRSFQSWGISGRQHVFSVLA